MLTRRTDPPASAVVELAPLPTLRHPDASPAELGVKGDHEEFIAAFRRAWDRSALATDWLGAAIGTAVKTVKTATNVPMILTISWCVFIAAAGRVWATTVYPRKSVRHAGRARRTAPTRLVACRGGVQVDVR